MTIQNATRKSQNILRQRCNAGRSVAGSTRVAYRDMFTHPGQNFGFAFQNCNLYRYPLIQKYVPVHVSGVDVRFVLIYHQLYGQSI